LTAARTFPEERVKLGGWTKGSIAIIAGAVVIHYTGWLQLDPALSILIALLIVWTFIALFPIYWTLSTSVKLGRDVTQGHLIPWVDFAPSWRGWQSLGLSPDTIFNTSNVREEFLRKFINSVICSVGASAFAIVIGSLAAYGLSRFDYKFGPWRNKDISFFFVSQLILPPVVLAPRHGFGGFVLGLAPGRIGVRRPDMNLTALADRPAVPQFPQWVRFDPERERVSFDHDRIMRQRRPDRQKEIPPSCCGGAAARALAGSVAGTIKSPGQSLVGAASDRTPSFSVRTIAVELGPHHGTPIRYPCPIRESMDIFGRGSV